MVLPLEAPRSTARYFIFSPVQIIDAQIGPCVRNKKRSDGLDPSLLSRIVRYSSGELCQSGLRLIHQGLEGVRLADC